MKPFALFAFLLVAFAAPAPAVAAKDPCGDGPKPAVTAYLKMDRDIAIFIAKHAQRACRLIDNFSRAHPGLYAAQFGAVIPKLRADVLEPIYVAYPAMRGRDVTVLPALPYENRFKKGAQRESREDLNLSESRLGDASARYLDRKLGETLRILGVSANPDHPTILPKSEALEELHRNVTFEIGVCRSPIYARLPDLLRKIAAENAARPTTISMAEHFRKVAPPPGSVRFTPGALRQIREFYDAVRSDPISKDSVIDVAWALGSAMRGPEDREWKKEGPGVSIGGWSRHQVPADVIRVYDGVPLVFGGDSRERFAGKLIDVEGKRFVIKDP